MTAKSRTVHKCCLTAGRCCSHWRPRQVPIGGTGRRLSCNRPDRARGRSSLKAEVMRATYPRATSSHAVGGVLVAVPFDLRRLEVTSGPTPIVEGVLRATTPMSKPASHISAFLTPDRSFMFPGLFRTPQMQLDLVRLDGKGSIEPLKLPPGPYEFPSRRADGKRLAFGTDDGRDANRVDLRPWPARARCAGLHLRKESFSDLVRRRRKRGVPIRSRRRPRHLLAARRRHRHGRTL